MLLCLSLTVRVHGPEAALARVWVPWNEFVRHVLVLNISTIEYLVMLRIAFSMPLQVPVLEPFECELSDLRVWRRRQLF